MQVAFFGVPESARHTSALEPEGRFVHVALSYRGGWIHAHPLRGVQLVSSLEAIGPVSEIWDNPRLAEPSLRWVNRQLLKSYDPRFRWKSRTTTYCSKLVGKFLHIPPTPMEFASPFWSSPTRPAWARHAVQLGGPGLSPDEIALWIRTQPKRFGWRSASLTSEDCARVLGHFVKRD